MSFDAFDQSDKGWRAIGQKRGCESKAVPIIRDYLSAHLDLSSDQRSQLLWHEAQLLALDGQYAESVSILRSISESDENQRMYSAATIAFLTGNKQALLVARSKLASLPKPTDFDAAAKSFHDSTGQTLSWPINLDVVDALIRCFGSSYRVAYTDSCAR
jgi:hypothetical protein